MKLYALVILAALFPIVANSQSAKPIVAHSLNNIYWGDTERGWFWYEDPSLDEADLVLPKALPRKSEKEHKAVVVPKAPELIQFEQLQKQLEDFRKIGIINPTESNVRRYMELEAKVVAQASYFADMAQRVAWGNPALDQTLQGRPVNAKAVEVFDREQEQNRIKSVASLAKDHVLFFFFRGNCPYCHAFAPVLEAFQTKYGIKVVPISIDGGSLPGFPAPRRDNGIARTLNVSQVPATFLAQPFTGKITPIGFGVLSESQLLERISIIAEPPSEAPSPIITNQISLQ